MLNKTKINRVKVKGRGDGYQLKAQGRITRKENIFVLAELSGALLSVKISEHNEIIRCHRSGLQACKN